MIRTTTRGLFAAGFIAALVAAPAAAGTCVEGGCHTAQTDFRFLHGPLAAETLGAEGCASCHKSTGPACTASAKGSFKLAADRERLCTMCHEKSTGSDHTARNSGCLECHSPHGSDRDATLLR